MNKQAILESRNKIYYFFELSFSNFEKYIGARTMDQYSNRNQEFTQWPIGNKEDRKEIQ